MYSQDSGKTATATYRIPAPGGIVEEADNGLYTINVQGGQVTDANAFPIRKMPARVLAFVQHHEGAREQRVAVRVQALLGAKQTLESEREAMVAMLNALRGRPWAEPIGKVVLPEPIVEHEVEYESVLVAFEDRTYSREAVATAVTLAARRRRGVARQLAVPGQGRRLERRGRGPCRRDRADRGAHLRTETAGGDQDQPLEVVPAEVHVEVLAQLLREVGRGPDARTVIAVFGGGPAVEQLLALEQARDDLDRFAQPGDPGAGGVQFDPGRGVLRLVPPGTDAHVQPALRQQVEGGDHLGEEGGITEVVAQGHRSHPYRPGGRRERGHGRPALEGSLKVSGPAVLAPVQEQVIGDPHRVESGSLGSLCYGTYGLPGNGLAGETRVVMRKSQTETHASAPERRPVSVAVERDQLRQRAVADHHARRVSARIAR